MGQLKTANDYIEWFWKEFSTREQLTSHHNNGICQCSTEYFIDNSSSPYEMRSFLMIGIFIDQMMFTHFQDLYSAFLIKYKYPKIYSHPTSGMAKPSWFVYSYHGYDKKMKWESAKPIAEALCGDLYDWLYSFPCGEEYVNRFKKVSLFEINLEFERETGEKFRDLLSNIHTL